MSLKMSYNSHFSKEDNQKNFIKATYSDKQRTFIILTNKQNNLQKKVTKNNNALWVTHIQKLNYFKLNFILVLKTEKLKVGRCENTIFLPYTHKRTNLIRNL